MNPIQTCLTVEAMKAVDVRPTKFTTQMIL